MDQYVCGKLQPLHDALLAIAHRLVRANRPDRPDPEVLRNALKTATDEDRLHYAEEYGEQILRLTDNADAVYFRKCVLRKETAAFIRYQKQRDHSVHTLHNYLLGLYFFDNSLELRSQLHAAMRARKTTANNPEELRKRFAEVWCYTSLLHDVGYLFEGTTSEGDTLDLMDEMVRNGRDSCLDYFNDVFWRDLGFRDADRRQIAQALIRNKLEPGEGTGGPSTIVYFLRNLGPWDVLARDLKEGEKLAKKVPGTLSSDAFQLWRLHYRQYNQPKMAKRFDVLEDTLYDLFENGIPEERIPRHLDHGLCGALMLLKYSTWWFRAFLTAKYAVDAVPPPSPSEAEVIGLITKTTKHEYNAAHWWSSILWATAAIAIHNLQQHPKYLPHHSKLSIAEDPLAYLGILVDILQEWDRHSVRRLPSISSDKRCINSRDIDIGVDPNGIIRIEYGCRDNSAIKREAKMISDLNAALKDWKNIVTFKFTPK